MFKSNVISFEQMAILLCENLNIEMNYTENCFPTERDLDLLNKHDGFISTSTPQIEEDRTK
jgi:hypothetical protein